MAYVTEAKCWICGERYTQVNRMPWTCPSCYPEQRERLKALERDVKMFRDKYVALKEKVGSLYAEIAHGDAEHQQWLALKLKDHFGEEL